MADEKSRLWRPLALCGVLFALWLARQPVQRVQDRWQLYAVLAGVLAGCAAAVWGVQRLGGRRWPAALEVAAVFALLVGLGAVAKYAFPPPAGGEADVNAFMAGRAADAVREAERDFGVRLDYGPDSMAAVEEILGKLHERQAGGQLPPDELRRAATDWGAYVGEVIRRLKGGHWEQDSAAAGPHSYPLHWEDHQSFPCAWCYKRITNGPEDDVRVKFEALVRGKEEGLVPVRLDDAEARHREAPDTFPIPPAEERRNLRPGQLVKLMFALPAGGEEQVERMWVEVTGRDGDAYVGELRNQPVSTDRLRPGSRVRFEPRHVIAVRRPKGEKDKQPEAGRPRPDPGPGARPPAQTPSSPG